MSGFSAIDLSQVPAPNVVEPLNFESVLADLKAELLAIDPILGGVLDFESEPVIKLLEAFAYRELLLRGRVNDAARAVMLAQPSTVKRPVVEWPDGSITVGFDEKRWSTLL